MKIVVLVKHVPEPAVSWRFAQDQTLDRASVEGRLSELDEYAVEQAVSSGARPMGRPGLVDPVLSTRSLEVSSRGSLR